MRRTSLAAGVLAACPVLAAGCGSDANADPEDDGAPHVTADPVPITQAVIAAVMLEHLPAEPVGRSGSRRSAHLVYPIEDGHDNAAGADEESVKVSISADTGDPCAGMRDALTGCEVRQLEDGELTVYWQDEEPYEDPGILELVLVRADDSVRLSYSGVLIASDPREQEFVNFSFGDMVDVVTDPRLGLATTPETVDAGADLEWP